MITFYLVIATIVFIVCECGGLILALKNVSMSVTFIEAFIEGFGTLAAATLSGAIYAAAWPITLLFGIVFLLSRRTFLKKGDI